MEKSDREQLLERMYFRIFIGNCDAMKLLEKQQYQEAYLVLMKAGQETEEMFMSADDEVAMPRIGEFSPFWRKN